MTALLIVVVVSLAVILLWGLLAPRSQWRVLVSWSQRNPRVDEPSGAAYTLYRLVAALGIVTMVVSGVLTNRALVGNQPVPAPPPTAAELMWGSPVPVVVNRVIHPVEKVPTGLVDQPILGYQAVSGKSRQPSYLFSLPVFGIGAATTTNGLVGTIPTPGLEALDTAGIVVQVDGDPVCFPHQVVVREDSKSVHIGVFYGRASLPDGSNAENVTNCVTRASGRNVSTLVPIVLEYSLGDRSVLTLDGDAIYSVEPIE